MGNLNNKLKLQLRWVSVLYAMENRNFIKLVVETKRNKVIGALLDCELKFNHLYAYCRHGR